MKGKIKIRLGNESQEPMVVYVAGWNPNIFCWVCHKLNTGDIVFTKENSLIDFNYKKFQQLFYQWKIENQDIVKARYVQMLNDLEVV